MDISVLLQTWGPLIGALLPVIITLIPGLRNLFAALPQSFFDAVVAVKGGKITWPAQASKTVLQAELNAMAETGAYQASHPDHAAYRAKVQQFEAIGDGTIINRIKDNPMILLAIVGGIVFFTMNGKGGGCKKVDPTPAPPVVKQANGLLIPGGN